MSNTTDIERLTFNGERCSDLFDLQGRKVIVNGDINKGIYIMNGKKVVIK
jgi:hypothetical protein